MIHALAARPHHEAHIRPVSEALGGVTFNPGRRAAPEDVALVASYGDLARARRAGYRRKVLMQHGAGQSYAGDPRTARHPAYPGGDDNEDVGLFLVPNEGAAARWRERYPGAAVEVVGCPRMDRLHSGAVSVGAAAAGDPPTVAVSFHWNYHGIPEMRSAFEWYSDAVTRLTRGGYDLIGHAHPKRRDLAGWYASRGIKYVADFDEVLRRADVYVTDNSSTLFEFAVKGPVVVLNAPWYRQDVDHGLRFWWGSYVGRNVNDPEDLEAGILDALRDNPGRRMARYSVLQNVYPFRGSSAARAAAAVLRWAA